MKRAVIDLGTNTFHLLIADISKGDIAILHKNQVAVTLGDGGIHNGVIAGEAYARGQSALASFREALDEFQCEEHHAFATSAIRSASNGQAFVDEAWEKHRIKINIISGLQEAELIYKGVRATLPNPGTRHLVMDIGGGSVEFILGDESGMRWSHSFDIGCARLVDRFHKEDPIPEASITDLYEYLDEELVLLKTACESFPPVALVGSAGSFESIMTLNKELFGKEATPIDDACFEIELKDYEVLHELLILSSELERSNMKGLADYRVRMMVVASIMITYVVETYNIDKLYCSMHSLKEGVLLS